VGIPVGNDGNGAGGTRWQCERDGSASARSAGGEQEGNERKMKEKGRAETIRPRVTDDGAGRETSGE